MLTLGHPKAKWGRASFCEVNGYLRRKEERNERKKKKGSAMIEESKVDT